MGLETGTFISDLNASNPAATDPKSQGDDHLRLIKSTIKATFPNVNAAVNPTPTEFNYLVGVTSSVQTQINTKGAVAGQTWTGTHDFTGATINVPTASPGDNDTSAASTAFVAAGLALKANLASPALTGTPTAPTASPSTNTTQIATTAFVQSVATNAALPNQSGNAGKVLQTDGTNASWALTLATQAEAEAGTISTALMTPLRTSQAIAALAPGWEDIGALSPTASDTAISFTGISTSYKDLEIVFENVTVPGSTPAVQLALGDATPTYTSPLTITNASTSYSGALLITDARADYGAVIPTVSTGSLGSSPTLLGAAPYSSSAITRRITGGVRAVRVTLAAGINFAGAGTIRLRGRK